MHGSLENFKELMGFLLANPSAQEIYLAIIDPWLPRLRSVDTNFRTRVAHFGGLRRLSLGNCTINQIAALMQCIGLPLSSSLLVYDSDTSVHIDFDHPPLSEALSGSPDQYQNLRDIQTLELQFGGENIDEKDDIGREHHWTIVTGIGPTSSFRMECNSETMFLPRMLSLIPYIMVAGIRELRLVEPFQYRHLCYDIGISSVEDM